MTPDASGSGGSYVSHFPYNGKRITIKYIEKNIFFANTCSGALFYSYCGKTFFETQLCVFFYIYFFFVYIIFIYLRIPSQELWLLPMLCRIIYIFIILFPFTRRVGRIDSSRFKARVLYTNKITTSVSGRRRYSSFLLNICFCFGCCGYTRTHTCRSLLSVTQNKCAYMPDAKSTSLCGCCGSHRHMYVM